MSPSPRELPVHWIHRSTLIPRLYISWCGHRVWKRGPRYPGPPRPIGVMTEELADVTCEKCRRRAAPYALELVERDPFRLRGFVVAALKSWEGLAE